MNEDKVCKRRKTEEDIVLKRLDMFYITLKSKTLQVTTSTYIIKIENRTLLG